MKRKDTNRGLKDEKAFLQERRLRMRYKLVVFDIDGTITKHISSWQFLHERLGQWNNRAIRYQQMFLAGKISYRKFCRLDAAHWKEMEASKLYKVFEEIPYAKNVERAVKVLRDRRFKLAAVSTGIQFIVDRVKKDLGLDYALSNQLKVRAGRLTGGVKVKISHLGKGKVLESILKRFHIPASSTIVVGDSAGDIPMMKMAGYAIAFNASSRAVSEAADYCCQSDDFMEVCKKILDVSEAEVAKRKAT
jgi:phosphoserine phosphatase